MATSARELVGWTEQRWTAVEESAKKALARTAKCRQVIPIGAEQIGAKTVVISTIPTIAPRDPIAYGPEKVVSPIQIFVDAALDDQIADDEAAVCRLVEFAAAQLGLEEDKAVIEGVPSGPTKSAGDTDLSAPQRRRLRTPELSAMSLAPKDGQQNAKKDGQQNAKKDGQQSTKKDGQQIAKTPIRAKEVVPTATEIVAAVRTAQGKLEAAGRPGPCGLLLHSHLFATLLDVAPGGTPYLQQVEQFIDSNEIVGTSVLDGSNDADRVCGVLFRLEPPAVELVQTARPTVTVLGRVNGQTELRVEEDIVLRILDLLAINQIVY
jgi:uncharacterized linocin/CFP29 family protein